MNSTDHNTFLLWTSQQQIVIDALNRDGIYTVKKEYVHLKYEDFGLSFYEAYSFFSQNAPAYAVKPEGAESPIWMHPNTKWYNPADNPILIKCRIPEEYIIFFDMRLWNDILNLKYLPTSEKDKTEFESELRRMGIKNYYSLFSTQFYPLQKAKVKQSWKQLFLSGSVPDEYKQAAVWCLKKEWIEDIIFAAPK